MELKAVLEKERKGYFSDKSIISFLWECLRLGRKGQTWRFQKNFRKAEYYFNKKETNPLYYLFYLYYDYKRNKLGNKLNLDLGFNTLASGVVIEHTNIIVGSAKVGANCIFHGQNCIGSGAVVGDDCELMVGAKVFGPAKLGNNITVAAGAIVLGEFLEDNILIGGVPAKILKKKC